MAVGHHSLNSAIPRRIDQVNWWVRCFSSLVGFFELAVLISSLLLWYYLMFITLLELLGLNAETRVASMCIYYPAR